MCSIFKHLVKHLVNKGHSIPVLVYLQDFYNNTRYCYELKCGPGQRGLSGHSQRFPSLECEAYPRDLLVDCVWFKRAFTLVSEKRWHHNCHRLWWHCGCRYPFSRTLFPSSCDVFSLLLSSFVTSLVCTLVVKRLHNRGWYWSMYAARQSFQFWYDLCHVDSELFHHGCLFWSSHPLEEFTIKDMRLEILSHELLF